MLIAYNLTYFLTLEYIMRHLKIEGHDDILCRDNAKMMGTDWTERAWCENHESNFLFFIGNEFILLTYFGCSEYGNHLDFKEDVIKRVTSLKELNVNYVNRAITIDKILKSDNLRGKIFKRTINQFVYIYSDNADRRYAFTYRTNWINIDMKKISDSYNKMVSYTKELGIYHYVEWQLNNLYEENMSIFRNTTTEKVEIELVKSINNLTKKINYEVNRERNN